MSRTKGVLLGVIVIGFAQTVNAGVRVGNGGDPIDNQLESVRLHIVRTLSHLIEHYPGNHFSLVDACSQTRIMNENELDTCIDFLVESAMPIVTCNTSVPKTPFFPEIPDSDDSYLAEYPDDKARPVSAITKMGCNEPIYYHYERTRNLQPKQLFELTLHEFGHKIRYRGQEINDIGKVGGFEHGSDLLNAAARAAYLYGLSVETIQQNFLRQAPKKDWFVCTLQVEQKAPVTIRSFSLREALSETDYRSLNAHYHRLGLPLRPYMGSAIPDESFYLFMRIEERNGCDAAGNGDGTDYRLMRDLGSFGETVVDRVFPDNVLCIKPSPPFTLSSPEYNLNLTCVYDGYHSL